MMKVMWLILIMESSMKIDSLDKYRNMKHVMWGTILLIKLITGRINKNLGKREWSKSNLKEDWESNYQI